MKRYEEAKEYSEDQWALIQEDTEGNPEWMRAELSFRHSIDIRDVAHKVMQNENDAERTWTAFENACRDADRHTVPRDKDGWPEDMQLQHFFYRWGIDTESVSFKRWTNNPGFDARDPIIYFVPPVYTHVLEWIVTRNKKEEEGKSHE